MTTANAIHAATRTVLLYTPAPAVFVGGVPGPGKTTFLARTVMSDDAVVLDPASVRRRLRAGAACTPCHAAGGVAALRFGYAVTSRANASNAST